MCEIEISGWQLHEFRRFQVRERNNCIAAFSTNAAGELWPFRQWGYTAGQNRDSVSGIFRLLDKIAAEYRKVRPSGGRFFIDRCGVYFKPESNEIQFVAFRLAA